MAHRRSPHLRATTWTGRLRDFVNDAATRSPARFAIVIFAALILLFTGLFSLPLASSSGSVTPLADAFFTAVSVICVTGLSTVDMATHWSGFGHTLVYIGVQVGAAGVLTFASVLGMMISRRLGLRAKLIAASDSNPLRLHRGPVAEGQAVRLSEVGSLLATVAISGVIIEVALALLLFPRMLAHGIPLGQSITDAFYYSAMAFTNTGFTPNAAGLAPFATDYLFLGTLMIGVFLGAIGFPVIYALARQFRGIRQRGMRRGWPLHAKLTVVTFAILFLAGGLFYLLLESDNPGTFGRLGAGDTTFQAFFLSAMTRSGGFSTIDINNLHGSSMLVTDMLMFIGGGSASTAGGIKVTTFAVIFLAAFAEARGWNGIDAFHRRIPTDVLRLAVSVVLWGATIVAVSTILVIMITKQPLDAALFEVISAFATCGLSTGLSENAPTAAVYVLALTMFMGRVGTVTLATAIAQTQRRRLYRLPEERPIVG